MVSPLLPTADFLSRAEREMVAGHEYYCLLEKDEVPNGFLWISVPEETCEIWGRHLRTLFHACAWFAFEKLEMPRLNWCVRQSNRRFISVCELFSIRKTGERFLCNIGERFEFIAVGSVNYYEFLAEEYFERIPVLEKYSMGASIFLEGASDNSFVGSNNLSQHGG